MGHSERVICLAKHKYGEADLILRFISSGGDVFSALAKSALKSRKRFGGGVLEPTHHMMVGLTKPYVAGTERLPILSEAQLLDDFSPLKKDYDRLHLALEFVRWVSTVAREGDSHKEIFNLLGHALKAAENSTQLPLLKIQFQIKLLHLQGMLPPEDRFLPFTKTPIREHHTLVKNLPTWRDFTQDTENFLSDYVGASRPV
jgi:DNA repair protein RecO (recombination protein O)